MRWIRRHAWWLLLFTAVLLLYFGITDLLIGAPADPGIALGLSGKTLAELEAESASAYRMFDLFTRVNGWSMLGLGALATVVLLVAYRREQRWAWWAMWVLPAWAGGVFVFYLVVGTDAQQAPPPPMISGPIIAVFTAAAQAVSAPRFFRKVA